MIRKTIALLFVWKVWFLFLAVLVIQFLPFQERYSSSRFGEGLPYLVKIWGNFDGYQYMEIAETGYKTDNIPFFPLYPMTIFVLHVALRIPFLTAGLLISHVTFFIALAVIFHLFKKEVQTKEWPLFLSLLFFFPTAFFYGAVYNDSLFLLWSVGCIAFARKRVWLGAAIMGVLATLARLNGLALAVFMFVEFLSTQKVFAKGVQPRLLFDPRTVVELFLSSLKSGFWTVVAIPLTYISYLGYIQIVFGDWRKIHHAMVVWGQDRVIFPPVVFFRYLKIFLTVPPFSLMYIVAVIEFLFACFYVFLSVYSYGKIRFSYWVLMVVSFIIPSLTGTFAGMPRYALHLFPCFLGIYVLWKRSDNLLRGLLIALALCLQFLIVLLFTRGYFVT